ncbi:hypothetical protein [Enterococcus pallens]|uniref:Uncharacterized protein n=1 Tax=Enterococcus pallens ATCC BAA-351 TaxID=1158607 RepID=R2QI58_9ENTE|nr:hypothetical protein [Enterococcus pallens]EOH94863.1 hypothetical protein UAU_01785 [Enterococcus pallens ATCC BAA-351]EOU14818.1 hypothetical protein I588_04468 [Enterococcus pallens ATCC BAA-351]
MESYEEQIVKLRVGEIKEIEVSKDNFFLWRETWLKQEDKKFFRGIAAHKGNVTYVYDESVI